MARLQNQHQALADTVHWCQIIKTASGLHDHEIEEKLFDDTDAPSGRRFNRWRKGENAMTPNTLQQALRNAVKLGWVHSPNGLVHAIDIRAGLDMRPVKEWNSEVIAKHNKSVKYLHIAHEAAIAALDQLRQAISGAHNVVVLNTMASEDENPEFSSHEIAEMMQKLKHTYFHDMSPWTQQKQGANESF